MNAEYDAAGSVGAGSEYWSYDESDNFGFLDLEGNEKPALAAAVVRPYPERVAGDLVSYAFDASTQTFSLVMTSNPAISAPTIVSLPPRLYPSGAQVECGGCTVTRQTGSVELTHIAPGTSTITVRPQL